MVDCGVCFNAGARERGTEGSSVADRASLLPFAEDAPEFNDVDEDAGDTFADEVGVVLARLLDPPIILRRKPRNPPSGRSSSELTSEDAEDTGRMSSEAAWDMIESRLYA